MRISLWLFSDVWELLLPPEPRDRPALGDMDNESIRIWMQVVLPLPGGPATIRPDDRNMAINGGVIFTMCRTQKNHGNLFSFNFTVCITLNNYNN